MDVCVCSAEVGPASMIVGNLVAGKRIAQACGRDVTQLEDNEQVLTSGVGRKGFRVHGMTLHHPITHFE